MEAANNITFTDKNTNEELKDNSHINFSNVSELAEQICALKTGTNPVHISLLIGAGMSVSAGIPTANDMMTDLKELYPVTMAGAKNKTYADYMKCLQPGTRKEIIKGYISDPKVNLAHLYMGSLVKAGYIDRILTTNFDPIAAKALSLNNIFPSIYDLAETRRYLSNEIIEPAIFYIHGKHNGYYVYNTHEEVRSHAKAVSELIEDTSKRRIWIIVGYSGENDALIEHFVNIEEYPYGLYWIGYNDESVAESVSNNLLSKPNTKLISGYDADNFFICLANLLGIDKPTILENPLTFLEESIQTVANIEKGDMTIDITEKAKDDIVKAKGYLELRKNDEKSVLIRDTRDIWVYQDYHKIEKVYDQVLKSNVPEAFDNLKKALANYLISLKREERNEEAEKITKLIDNLNKRRHIATTISSLEYSKAEAKETIKPNQNSKFYDESIISVAGYEEATKIFGTTRIKMIGKRYYGSDLLQAYIYRIYILEEDFSCIKAAFKENSQLNVLKAISEKKNYHIHYEKTHQFIATTVGEDSDLLHVSSDKPALLHLQITYDKDGDKLSPIEFLIGKYISPINMAGFISDYQTHSGSEFSQVADNTVEAKWANELILKNKQYYHSYFSFNKLISKIYSGAPSLLLRVMLVNSSNCNYNCQFCCFISDDENKIPLEKLDLSYFKTLLDALIKAGGNRIMFTGGEPLKYDWDDLITMIRLTKASGLEDYWITTNGSLLSEEKATDLKNAGLDKLVVSIPGYDSETYMEITRAPDKTYFRKVLDNIKYAIGAGIKIRVDVPISHNGVDDYDKLITLIGELKKVGVREIAYFKLHQTKENKDVYNTLAVDVDKITERLHLSDDWRPEVDKTGRFNFIKDDFAILVPTNIELKSRHCKGMKEKCGDFCQGNYASYLYCKQEQYIIRACHRDFDDGRNERNINQEDLDNNNVDGIAEVFKQAWGYVNEQI